MKIQVDIVIFSEFQVKMFRSMDCIVMCLRESRVQVHDADLKTISVCAVSLYLFRQECNFLESQAHGKITIYAHNQRVV